MVPAVETIIPKNYISHAYAWNQNSCMEILIELNILRGHAVGNAGDEDPIRRLFWVGTSFTLRSLTSLDVRQNKPQFTISMIRWRTLGHP